MHIHLLIIRHQCLMIAVIIVLSVGTPLFRSHSLTHTHTCMWRRMVQQKERPFYQVSFHFIYISFIDGTERINLNNSLAVIFRVRPNGCYRVVNSLLFSVLIS